MEEQDLQSKIDSISWYHDVDFPGGLKARSSTPDADDHRRTWEFIERNLQSVDFRGKSVLDIGCWDGYWSFYAERRGARSVLAADDITQNWAAGEGLLLAKDLLDSGIEVNQALSVYDLASLQQTFDVILCLGVYYHLHAPLFAFSQIRHCCGPETVVVFEGDVARNQVSGWANYNPGDPQKSTFVPSDQLLETMLKAAYLDTSRAAYLGESGIPSVKALAKRNRRWRNWWESTPIRRNRRRRRNLRRGRVDRALLICRPFERPNEIYYYKPPFGLDKFDPRFSIDGAPHS
jgi:tRNA (mo5U34)-methyltransferase